MSNTIKFLPSIGMAGFYSLSAPYNSLLSTTTQYTCVGVMSITGAEAQGVDVLNGIYLANGDTLANYTAAVAAKAMLISVSAGGGDIFTFPSSALLGVPTGEGVIYRNTVMGIGLSAIPDTMDLTALQNEIMNLVYNTLGVKSTVFLTTIGAATILTPAQDALITSARSAAITNPSNTHHQNLLLTQENVALVSQLNALQDYIKTLIH